MGPIVQCLKDYINNTYTIIITYTYTIHIA